MGKKRNKNELQGRVLAIDYGERRIGLAISDPLFITAQGLDTVVRSGRKNPIEDILRIIREYAVGLIIVGMPLTLSGNKKEAWERVRLFADELEGVIELPIEFVDERLSSVAAKRALIEMGHKTGHHKELVDKIAAVFILQTYLDGL